MPSIEEEIAAIQAMTDIVTVRDKITGRKRQLTKIASQLRILGAENLSSLNPSEVEKRHREAVRSTALFAALQDKYEALLKSTESESLEDEIQSGQTTRDENERIVDKAEMLKTQLAAYDDGVALLEELRELLLADNLELPIYQQRFHTLQERAISLKRSTRFFAGDSEIAKNNTEITASIREFQLQVAKTQKKAIGTSSVAADSSKPIEIKPSSYYHSKLTLDLPKFSGKPVDWASFKSLFTSVMESAGAGLPDPDRCCHLLKAMTTEEARKVVRTASEEDKGYEQALKDLEETYGRPGVVYPAHLLSLLKITSFNYDYQGIANFRDKFEPSIRGMKSCDGYTAEQILGGIAVECFGEQMAYEWSTHIAGNTTLPKIDDILEFFKKRQLSMKIKTTSSKPASSSKVATSKPEPSKKTSHQPTPYRTVNRIDSTGFKCLACGNEGHPVSRCRTFQEWPVDRRQKAIRDARHCFNCFSHTHSLRDCTSSFTCRHCGGKHHTLLHKTTPVNSPSNSTPPAVTAPAPVPPEGAVLFSYTIDPKGAILSTAMFQVTNMNLTQRGRLLMDNGSNSSLITESMASRLQLRRTPHRATFACASGPLVSKCIVRFNLASVSPLDPVEEVTVICHVVPHIPSSKPPSNPRHLLNHPIFEGKSPVADPDMGGSVDVLLSITDSNRCIRGHPVNTRDRTGFVTPTIFGWTVGGTFPGAAQGNSVMNVQRTTDPLDSALQQLWAMDQTPDQSSPRMSKEDEEVVAHFQDTHQVLPDGRYSVCLPRKTHPPTLGESRPTALRRFLRNERSLQAKEKLNEFNKVLNEYHTLDHAEVIPENQLAVSPTRSFYLPIHGVSKETSTTTKLRAVFDASAKTSSGVSLNDQLYAGPNMYPLLPSILNKFRFHIIAMSSDISKMFREVVLDMAERDYHRFLMRDQEGKIVDCRMKRLTFGVKSSPYIATQVLRQLADCHETEYPLAADVVRHGFYVDDCLTGANTVAEADLLRKQLCDLLALAGMNLRKWRSNSAELLATIPDSIRESADLEIKDPLSASKALGIHWHIATDDLHVAVPEVKTDVQPTKRIVASTAAGVFDALGLYAPVTIVARMLLQEMWKQHLEWDEKVPEEIAIAWNRWTSDLTAIAANPVSRRIVPFNSPVLFYQVHGFSDASMKAYGAAIYLRTVYTNTEVSIVLSTAKARVTPLKQLSIPKLELTAALLMVKMLSAMATDLNIPREQTFAWTDSSIVLAWLDRSPSDLKTFEGNRVAAITDILPQQQWRHVRSEHNPADLASRGAPASELLRSSLWWEGPPWLKKSPSEWPKLPTDRPPDYESGLKSRVCQVTAQIEPFKLWRRWSSFDKLARIVSWMRRFVSNVSKSKKGESKNLTNPLTSAEVEKSKLIIFQSSQREVYPEAFELVPQKKPLPRAHPLSRYDVHLDKNGLLRVSGRVRDKCNPLCSRSSIVLSLHSPLTKLFVSSRHVTNGHAGTSTLMAILAENFFIPGIRNFLKQLSRQCVVCQKVYANPSSQKMGLLPAVRTSPAPAFINTGMDFAGPFLIHRGNPRKPVRIKTYAVLLVCMVTRAVHIELCADLSTDSFLAALRRFCGRRGTPAHLYSDNGSNFIGAKREVEEIQALLNDKATQRGLSHLATKKGLQWHLIPPRAPHFGGLWEAGVKSMKTLLKKNLSSKPLSYDELETILIEVEAILNSRPTIPLHSTDPDAALALSAGHFLVGRPLTSPPSVKTDVTSKRDLLKRWNMVRRYTHDLWIQWNSRYVQSLAARTKWRKNQRNFRVGDVVLLKDESLECRSWPLALVVSVYPGTDGTVRTVDLRCQGHVYRRTTHRLVLLVDE